MSFEPYIRFYSDSSCTKEISTIQFKDITLTGTTKNLDVWVKNVSKYEILNVSISILDGDVSVEPLIIPLLLSNQQTKVTFIFKPPIGRTEPLNSQFHVECVMVRRA